MAYFQEPSHVLAAAIVFLILCPLTAALRFYSRVRLNKQQKLGLDDWLMVPASLLIIGCSTVLIVGVREGVLAHPTPQQDVSGRYFRLIEQYQWSFFMMQILGIGCVKLSFVLFFRRIFCVGTWRQPFNIVSGIVGLLVLIWTLAFFLWFLLSCGNNLAARWSSKQTYTESCSTDDEADLVLAITDFLTDLMVLILPVPMVLKLHMRLKRKLLVLMVFALGLVALVVSTVRMVFFIFIVTGATGSAGSTVVILPTVDQDLLVTEALYWSMVEIGLAFIACCLPTLNGITNLPSVRSFVASVRSLQSLGSGDRKRSGGNELPADQRDIQLRSKPSGISTRNGSAVADSYRNVPPERAMEREAPRMEIMVDHTIEQTTTTV